MSLKEEKMMILTLIQDGKITAQEAELLLNSLEAKPEETADSYEGNHLMAKDLRAAFNAASCEHWTDTKFKFKVQFDGQFYSASQVSSHDGNQNPHEEQVNLNLFTANGGITLHGWDEPHYHVELEITANADSFENAKKVAHNNIIINRNDNLLFIDGRYFRSTNFQVNIVIWLPNHMQYAMNLVTSNGGITQRNLYGKSIEASTSNGGIDLINSHAKTITATTSNGGINLTNSQADTIDATTCNGGINLTNSQADTIDATTSNGGIGLKNVSALAVELATLNGGISSDTGFKNFRAISSNGSIKAKTLAEGQTTCILATTNGSIDVELTGRPDLAIDLDLETQKGRLITELPEGALLDLPNDPKLKHIKAQTSDFTTYNHSLQLKVSTTTGSIRLIPKL